MLLAASLHRNYTVPTVLLLIVMAILKFVYVYVSRQYPFNALKLLVG